LVSGFKAGSTTKMSGLAAATSAGEFHRLGHRGTVTGLQLLE
jgi:hypothetical protein